MRRSPAKWALPFLVGFEWWVIQGTRSPGFALWSQIGPAFLYSLLVIGPAAAAFAGLRAWSERRPSLDDLMVTSALDPIARQSVAVFGDVAWVGVAYLVTLGAVVATVAPQASWGGPDVAMLTAGFLAVWACGSIGWLIGWLMPSRTTGPIVGVALYLLMGLALSLDSTWQVLSPSGAPRSLRPTEQLKTGFGWWQAAWFTGIALTGLAAAALLARSRHSRWLVGSGALMAAIAAMVLIPGGVGRSKVVDPPQVCEQGEIELCYHPAFASGMAEVKRAVVETIAPLVEAGVLPPMAVMEEVTPVPVEDPQWVPFSPWGGPDEISLSVAEWAVSTSECSSSSPDIPDESSSLARSVIKNWLVVQAGYNPAAMVTISDASGRREATLEEVVDPESLMAIKRFVELSRDQQVSWLAANFNQLRHCATNADDLP